MFQKKFTAKEKKRMNKTMFYGIIGVLILSIVVCIIISSAAFFDKLELIGAGGIKKDADMVTMAKFIPIGVAIICVTLIGVVAGIYEPAEE